MPRKAKVLVYTSSADHVPHREGGQRSAGTFLVELVAPLRALVDAGHTLQFATPDGRPCVIDQTSRHLFFWRFSPRRRDRALAFVERLRSMGFGRPNRVGDIVAAPAALSGFDALFVPGGHAPMTDVVFADWTRSNDFNRDTGNLLAHFHATRKPTALICHAPAALAAAPHVNGKWIYDGYRMTCVSVLADRLLEDVPLINAGGHMPDYPRPILERSGGKVSNAMLGRSYLVEDRELLTGQDHMSAGAMGAALLKKIERFCSLDAAPPQAR
jgi:putative intracellular protease/amidase